MVDDCDLYLLDKYKWYIRKDDMVYTKINKETIYLSRLIMYNEIIIFESEHNCKAVVDHIHHNRLDNRRSKLRVVSQNDNMMNRTKQINNTSGYKGISITVSGTYAVDIKYKNKRYRKTLKSMEEAVEWRKNIINELNILEPILNDIDYNEYLIKEKYTYTDEHKKNISRGNIGKKHTEETKIKMSKAHMGMLHTEETKLKISEIQKGNKRSEKTKLKISDGLKKAYYEHRR